jgi:uncharacterized membrane protein YfcA
VDWWLFPIFALIGLVVGFLAGLLGIGGGMTIVPLLTLIFTHEHFPPEHILHMAIATSMATIVFTSIASVREHHAHDAVLWPVFWRLAPGMLVGSFVGPLVVGGMSTTLLSAVFATFAGFIATTMLVDRKPKPTRQLPGAVGLFSSGVVIGMVASLVGAGGGFLSVPLMTACNVRIRNAVGTSAALGLPIAVAGTVGFVVAGLRQTDLPPYTVGFIYVPGLIAIVAATVVVAPIGARLSHRWPVAILRRAFACLLYAIAAFFLWKAFAP